MTTSTQNTATIGKILALAFLLAALAASLMLAAKPAHASTTFTINSTEDHADAVLTIGACDTGYTVAGAGGQQVDECTLRAAIEQANYTPGADTIEFAIPGSGVKTIAPESALPEITEAVSINGYTQPGAKPNTKSVGSDAVLKIELNGAGVPDGDGLFITASNSTVKGLVINRSSNSGIFISGSGATGNRVVGNYLGTDASGNQDLGNDSKGVLIHDAANNTVGGTMAGARNVISGNDNDGVEIFGNGATGNRVLSNSIFANGLLGIDLSTDNLQNFPVLSSAKKSAAGTTTVRGNLDSTPDKTFKVQFFSNPAGTDEGKTLLGSQTVSTDGSGDASITFLTKKAIRLGQNITATATGPGGNTSEFSAPRKVVAQ